MKQSDLNRIYKTDNHAVGGRLATAQPVLCQGNLIMDGYTWI